jgi:hypothetical protein
MKSGLDLNSLEKKLDASLEKETSYSLNEWIGQKRKNSYPSSHWEEQDRCPSCGRFCDIVTDLNENDECYECRSGMD